MASVVRNIITSSKNILNAAGSTLEVSSSVLVDATSLINTSIKAAPSVTRAVATVPFAAGQGYIMESEGVSREEAHARAYKYVDQDLSVTIEEAGEGAGKLLAQLMADETTEDDKANKDS